VDKPKINKIEAFLVFKLKYVVALKGVFLNYEQKKIDSCDIKSRGFFTSLYP